MSRTKPKNKRIADFPKPYRDALAYWCSFRKIGFEASEIFFGFGEVSGVPNCIYLQLQTQGKVFVATVAQLPLLTDRWQVFNTWKQLSKVMHRSTETERVACVRDHMIGNLDYFAAFVGSIQAKDIVVPELAHLSPHAGQA
jgi:hypothetical protein